MFAQSKSNLVLVFLVYFLRMGRKETSSFFKFWQGNRTKDLLWNIWRVAFE